MGTDSACASPIALAMVYPAQCYDIVTAMTVLDISPTDLMNRKQAADYLRSLACTITTARSLAKLAVDGGGPPYFMDGNRVLYSRAELNQWRLSRLRRKEPK